MNPEQWTDDGLFKVIEPSTGKTYRVFADGRIEGFASDALVFNRYPALTHLLRAAGRVTVYLPVGVTRLNAVFLPKNAALRPLRKSRTRRRPGGRLK